MKALQRRAPRPFTDPKTTYAEAGAVAGRPIRVEFRILKPPSHTEKEHG
jgi:hypothetical protein